MFGFLTKLFKSKKDRDVAALRPLVEETLAVYQTLSSLSDDQLRERTQQLRQRIQAHIAPTVKEMESVRQQVEALRQQGDIAGQDSLFQQLDELKKKRNTELEEVLAQIRAEAFSIVKETSRRLSQNGKLTVTATDWDRQMASRKANVQIEGDKAHWLNRWEAAGNEVVWNMVHYDVQLMGGTVLHQGKIAEMATGEGKTLVSTLPAFLNALSGFGVHLVTVNDYLARRDSQWNAPLFEFHQISVDCIDLHQPNTEERRQAYLADITYGTNNEFGFDYLRDNMVTHPEHLVQREHHFAMIDEVDSVLIDEARTPLIISGPTPQGDRHEFDVLKPRIERLVTLQRKLVGDMLNLAKANAERDPEAAGVALLRAHRGLPKHTPLIKFLSETGMKALLQKTEAKFMQDNSREMHKIDDELFFVIDERNNQIELSEKGRETITATSEDPNLFVLPDITSELYNIDNNAGLSSEEKLNLKDQLSRDFAEKSERLHSIHQLLKAYTLFERDVQYIVEEGKVMIVDEHTGRVLSGRRYSDGLHQAIEAKENVKVEAATQTFATVTLQNYFRMYHKLAGMTGTAETEAKELYDIYKLDVVVIPTNLPTTRKDMDDVVYKTRREKFNAIIDEVQKLTEAGRPVLVGTTSVETSELLSRMLRTRNIKHNVLNAKHHQREAEIVAEAGQSGTVTIATNMAGRGTDIKLGAGVREKGGLAIIGSERHESRRIDRQLRGRAGRQGDPGSSQFFVSLEDDLMRMFGSERIAKVMDFLKMKEGETIQDPLVTRSITNAQKKVEENNFSIRKRLLEYDDVMNKQREAIYRRRRNALFGERIKVDIDNMIYDFCADVAKRSEGGDAETLRFEMLRSMGFDPEVTEAELGELKGSKLTDYLYNKAVAFYERKQQRVAEFIYNQVSGIQAQVPGVTLVEVQLVDGARGVRIFSEIDKILETKGASVFTEFEKTVMLGVIDDKWKEHLREMDELKQSVQTAVYEQKDPLLIYKLEAYNLFQYLLGELNSEVLSMLFRGDMQERGEASRAPLVERDDFSRLKASHTADASQRAANVQERVVQQQAAVMNDDEEGDGRGLSRRERRAMDRKKK